MKLKELEYLRAIYEYGNISDAAKALYITRSALSKFLINTENEMGMLLFVRDGKKLIPTDAGHAYLEFVISTLDHLDRTQKRMDNLTKHGSFKIGVPMGLAPLITHALIRFHKLFPDIHVELIEKDFSQLDMDLLDEYVDLILTGTNSDERFVCDFFCSEEVLLYSPDHENTNPEDYDHVDIHLFKDKTFIFPSENILFNVRINDILQELNFEPKDRLYIKNHTQAFRLGVYGYGVAFVIVPDRYPTSVHDHLFRFTEKPLVFPIYTAYHPTSRNKKQIREFLHLLNLKDDRYLHLTQL